MLPGFIHHCTLKKGSNSQQSILPWCTAHLSGFLCFLRPRTAVTNKVCILCAFKPFCNCFSYRKKSCTHHQCFPDVSFTYTEQIRTLSLEEENALYLCFLSYVSTFKYSSKLLICGGELPRPCDMKATGRMPQPVLQPHVTKVTPEMHTAFYIMLNNNIQDPQKSWSGNRP